MKRNKHSKSMPNNKLELAQEKLAEVSSLLREYLITLTPEEKKEIPIIGPKTPGLVPPFVSMVDWHEDFKDAHDLWPLCNSIRQLLEDVVGTQTAASSESFQHSLLFYNSIKAAALSGVSGAKPVYDELKKRFPHPKKQKKGGEE